MYEQTKFPPDGATWTGSSEMPLAAADEPHPADAHAIEFDAHPAGEAPAFRPTAVPFQRADDESAGGDPGADEPWSTAVTQARLRLLQLQSEQVEPLRAAVLSHGREAQGQPTRGAHEAPGSAAGTLGMLTAHSPRLARRVQDLLDEAEIAADESAWAQAAEWLLDALVLDPENDEALALLAMVTRRLAVATAPAARASIARAAEAPPAARGPEAPPAARGPESPAATIEALTEPRGTADASLQIAIGRWEARGFQLRERSADAATLRERRRASLRGFLASLLLGVGLGGVVYLVYALMMQPRREVRLAIEGDRVAVSGELRSRNPVVVALDVVAAVAAIAALGLLAIGGAQIAGLL